MPKGRGPEGEIPLSKARRPRTPCRPSLILTSTRSLRSSRPAVTVATDDTQWFGRFARLLDGAGPGRRPQGLRCAHRQAPALALDPATQAQRVAAMPCCARRVRRRRGVISTLRTGCHFYLAPTCLARSLMVRFGVAYITDGIGEVEKVHDLPEWIFWNWKAVLSLAWGP